MFIKNRTSSSFFFQMNPSDSVALTSIFSTFKCFWSFFIRSFHLLESQLKISLDNLSFDESPSTINYSNLKCESFQDSLNKIEDLHNSIDTCKAPNKCFLCRTIPAKTMTVQENINIALTNDKVK